jgi:hypothetical protein
VVELAEASAGVADHARQVAVNRLGVREHLALVEIAEQEERLRHLPLDRGGLEAPAYERFGGSAQRPVERRDDPPADHAGQHPHRRGEPHLREVERASDHRHRSGLDASVGDAEE